MRIIAGKYKNRLLKMPNGTQTRPSSSMLREALFNIAQNNIHGKFLDLFAGSGAIGIEALSRGFDHITFVDHDKGCIKAIEQNIIALHARDFSNIIFSDCVKALQRMIKSNHPQFDIIFADPPYDSEIILNGEKIKQSAAILQLIDNHPILSPGGSLFIEDSCESLVDIANIALSHLQLSSSRRYGRSTLYHWTYPINQI